jgi:hypothetical protein
VALFSDVDWLIVLAAAAFLLFGKDSGETLRTLGRWYGRAGRIKQELLTEFSKAAEIPVPAAGASLTIRGALLGLDPAPTRVSGIPAHVTVPPGPAVPPLEPAWGPWTGGALVPTWSMTVPSEAPEGVRSR